MVLAPRTALGQRDRLTAAEHVVGHGLLSALALKAQFALDFTPRVG
jgi:hypothetical protein